MNTDAKINGYFDYITIDNKYFFKILKKLKIHVKILTIENKWNHGKSKVDLIKKV